MQVEVRKISHLCFKVNTASHWDNECQSNKNFNQTMSQRWKIINNQWNFVLVSQNMVDWDFNLQGCKPDYTPFCFFLLFLVSCESMSYYVCIILLGNLGFTFRCIAFFLPIFLCIFMPTFSRADYVCIPLVHIGEGYFFLDLLVLLSTSIFWKMTT